MSTDVVITGQAGTVSFGTVPTAVKITKWTLKKAAAPINTTDNSSSGFDEFVPAKVVNWTGTFVGFLRKGVTPPAFNQVVAFSGLADTGATYAGNVIINDESMDVDTVGGNAVQLTRSFQGTGTLTETNT